MKVNIVMVDNMINMTNTNNYLSTPTIDHKKTPEQQSIKALLLYLNKRTAEEYLIFLFIHIFSY